jgi:Rrf2 family iron-sulfur cluster assembly transcriptional regulator
MKLSTKGRHAVTAMMELALRQDKGPVTLADISTQQSISISYLEQLFARLRQNGLVTGMRGPGGGYSLARSASEITIANILNAVDDMVKRQEITSAETELPGSLMMWQRLSNQVYDYLDGISLAEAVESQHEDTQESLFGTGFQKSAA